MAEPNLTSYGNGSYQAESESLHSELFKLHDDIYQRACERIKKALLTLHKVETSNSGLRPVCKSYIAEFESLRESLEQVGRHASNLRTKLIRDNGCGGECSKERT